jgi:hypothetical protein
MVTCCGAFSTLFCLFVLLVSAKEAVVLRLLRIFVWRSFSLRACLCLCQYIYIYMCVCVCLLLISPFCIFSALFSSLAFYFLYALSCRGVHVCVCVWGEGEGGRVNSREGWRKRVGRSLCLRMLSFSFPPFSSHTHTHEHTSSFPAVALLLLGRDGRKGRN